MSIQIIPPSHAVYPGQEFTLTIISNDPGVVDLTYNGPIAGPSQVIIPGTRQYRYGGNPAGQYAARLLSSGQGQDRSPASWLIRLRPEDIAGEVAYQNTTSFAASHCTGPIIWCGIPQCGVGSTVRLNWMISRFWITGYIANSFRAAYPLYASPNPTSLPNHYSPTGLEYGNNEQYALACVNVVSNSILTRYMLSYSGEVHTSTTSCTLTGVMTGALPEVICAQWPFEQFIKYNRAISSAEAQNWLLYGTIPSDPQIAYLNGHEIDGTQRVYDSGPMGLHLGNHDMSQYLGNGFVSPHCAHRYIETSPVTPATITLTATGTGGVQISARRTRIGVPPDRPDSEKYETANTTFSVSTPRVWVGPIQTINARLYESPSASIHIVTTSPGMVNITCNPPIISFPSSVEIDSSLEKTVEGAILSAGSCEVTASME